MKFNSIIRGLVFVAALVAIGYLLGGVLDRAWVDTHVRGRGITGELLFVVAGALLISAGLSRQVVAFLGGYAFSFLAGTLLALVATVAGCIITFYYARLLCSSFVSRRYSGHIREVDNFIRENTFSMTLLFRLLPVGSNLMVNLAAGVSSVRGTPFFSGSLLGYIPQTLVFALIGSGTSVDQHWQVAVAVAMFIASAMLGIYLYRKHRYGKTLGADLDKKLGMDNDLADPETD
ncbi:MAG: VTT domain-containing protein [Gammaproteobacteria bacterium]